MKKCKIKGPCFAKIEGGRCRILSETPEGHCSFQKPEMMITGDKVYPYNPKMTTASKVPKGGPE